MLGAAAAFGQQLAQPVLHGQRQFDTAGAGADHADAVRAGGAQDPFDKLLPAGYESVDRLDRHHPAFGPADVAHSRGGADIDRQHVVGDRRTAAAQHRLVDQVEADGLVVIEARAGEPGQRFEVDMGVVEPVMAGHQPRQHAGIRRVHVAANECQPDPGQRLHAEPLEHGDMAVAASDQDQILDHRRVVFFHCGLL